LLEIVQIKLWVLIHCKMQLWQQLFRCG